MPPRTYVRFWERKMTTSKTEMEAQLASEFQIEMSTSGRQQTSGFGWIPPIAMMAGGAVEFPSTKRG